MRFLKPVFAGISLILLVAAAGMMLSSCVKEDLTDCPPVNNVRLLIQTQADATGNSPVYSDVRIDSVSVYIFDAEGRFVDLWSGGPYTNGEDYYADLQLEPGEYRFAVVTNPGDMNVMEYTLEELRELRPTIDEIEMSIGVPADGRIDGDIPDLYVGTLDNTVVTGEQQTLTAIIYPQLYHVNFTITGLPEDVEYSLTVSDQDFMRTLENALTATSDDLSYWRICDHITTTQRTWMEATMEMYNLSDDKQMPLVLTNTATGEVIFSGDLIEMIKNAYSSSGGGTVDFGTTFEFDIELNFDMNSTKLQVEITVNGWTYQEDVQWL